MKISGFVSVAIITTLGLSNSALAWMSLPLNACFEAIERGVVVKTFIKNEWFNPNTGIYHDRTDHIHAFYNGEIFDLFRTPTGEAFCEALFLYQG